MQQLYTPEQAADLLGIGRTKVFELIGNGTLASIKIGRLRRIPSQAIDDFVARLGFDPRELAQLEVA